MSKAISRFVSDGKKVSKTFSMAKKVERKFGSRVGSTEIPRAIRKPCGKGRCG